MCTVDGTILAVELGVGFKEIRDTSRRKIEFTSLLSEPLVTLKFLVKL